MDKGNDKCQDCGHPKRQHFGAWCKHRTRNTSGIRNGRSGGFGLTVCGDCYGFTSRRQEMLDRAAVGIKEDPMAAACRW